MLTNQQEKLFTESRKLDSQTKIFTGVITETEKQITIHYKERSHQLTGQNIYFNEMKPLFIVMRLIGRFPYSFTKTGFAPFSLISWPFLYSLVFNLIFGILTACSIQTIINDKVYPSQSYDETLFWCLLLLFALQNFIGPIAFFWDASRIVRYFQKWRDFENSWICGAMYSAKRLKFSKISSALLIPSVILILAYEAVTLPKISAYVFIPYAPILASAVLMLEHWWLTLHDLTMYSERLLISIFKVKDKLGMGQRRRTWLKISDLVKEIGNATGASGLSYTTCLFLGFILSVYAILIKVFRPGSSNVPLWGLLFPAAYCAISYYLAADAAHKATERIGPGFTKKLLQIDVNFMPRHCLDEIDLFLECLSTKSPVIEYHGFMKVTRNSFLLFVFHTVTYLIVLVQLKTYPAEVVVNTMQEKDDNVTSFETLLS